MMKALKNMRNPFLRICANGECHDIDFEVKIEDNVKIGEDFAVILMVKNHSDEKTHLIKGTVLVNAVTYTGQFSELVKSTTVDITVEPNSSSAIELLIKFDDYYKATMDDAYFKIICSATVYETDYEYYTQEDYRVRKPDIKISLDNDPVDGAPLYITATLQNTMPIALTNGVFRFETSGVWQPLEIPCDRIEEFETTTIRFMIKPRLEGNAQIAAKFNSIELSDVDGFLAFEVGRRVNDQINAGVSLNDALIFS